MDGWKRLEKDSLFSLTAARAGLSLYYPYLHALAIGLALVDLCKRRERGRVGRENGGGPKPTSGVVATFFLRSSLSRLSAARAHFSLRPPFYLDLVHLLGRLAVSLGVLAGQGHAHQGQDDHQREEEETHGG